MKKVLRISKIFQSVLVEGNVYQCRLITKKSPCIISFSNLHMIGVLFEYSNPLFIKIKSHVLSYLEMKYSPHHSLIEAFYLQR